MTTKTRNCFIAAGALFILFIVFTVLVMTADTAQIGPEGTSVGFSKLNGAFANAIGTNGTWYNITDILGYSGFAVAGFFLIIGVVQLIKRKRFFAVDHEILALGCIYVFIIAVYVIFEKAAVNYRPVILDPAKGIEASYPSSHTIFSCCIMITAIMYINRKIDSFGLKAVLDIAAISIAVVTVIGRAVSGVHWLTDILGGIIFSAATATLYYALLQLIDSRQNR